MSLPQWDVKVMEPHRNSSTTTNIKRSQTLILTEDRDDGAFCSFHTDSNGKGKPGQWP